MYIGWGTLAGNCNPTNCSAGCPQPAGQGWSYAGFVHREYEYRRFEAGVTPYFPKLRFPGHYFDEETDLHENWHRYYSPFLGSRYLSPEPLLQDPAYVRRMAQTGKSAPTYAYALNNPVRHTDPTGLDVPIEHKELVQWANDICDRCGSVTFRVNRNGPSRGPIGADPNDRTNMPPNNGGTIDGTVTSWSCHSKGCDPEKSGVSGGSIGVSARAWRRALTDAIQCGATNMEYE
jgi:RHS repeat-associated protein